MGRTTGVSVLSLVILALSCGSGPSASGPSPEPSLAGSWVAAWQQPGAMVYYNGVFAWGEDWLTIAPESGFERIYRVHASTCCMESSTVLLREVRGAVQAVDDSVFYLQRHERVESTFVHVALCWPYPCDLGLPYPETTLVCLLRNDTVHIPKVDSLRFATHDSFDGFAWIPFWRRAGP